MNNKGFAVSGIIYSVLILFIILVLATLSILGSRKLVLDKLKNEVMNKLNNEVAMQKVYTDKSGANIPSLSTKMIPILYDGVTIKFADVTKEWYDYDNKQWANAVILNEGVTKNVGDTIIEAEIAMMYVWIPRYKYTIFNGNNESVPEQKIKVTFEKGITKTGIVTCVDDVKGSGDSSEICTDDTNGSIVNNTSTYTHPAFTFGDKELTGIWVGKFESSAPNATTNSIQKITVKPNIASWRNATVSNMYQSALNIKTDYGMSGDSHMMKNMEWGSVAYLKQSKYGLGSTDIVINANNSYLTGAGNYASNTNQSTTGNITGIYDMSGGAYEYTMGNMINESGAFYPSSSGAFTPAAKYYDVYTYNTSNITHGRGKLGDATKETLSSFGNNVGGWTSDYAFFPSLNASWFVRGGSHSDNSGAGLFATGIDNGSAYSHISFRVVLTK